MHAGTQRYKIQYCFPSLNNLKTRYISVRLDKDIYSSILICRGWSIVDGRGSKEIFCQATGAVGTVRVLCWSWLP